MNVFIVFVKFKIPGGTLTDFNVRYVDSQWASEAHAKLRKIELQNSMYMGCVPSYEVDIRLGKVQDAAVTE